MRLKRLPWLGIAAFVLTVLAGRWGVSLFTTSEFVHFSINFPSNGSERQLNREEIGGPWTMVEEKDWAGVPVGGLIVWGRENHITVNLAKQGWIKKLIQPDVLTLSSHWIRNVGVRPYGICLEFDMCGFDLRFDTFETNWDPKSRCATRTIAPKENFNMDWIIQIPNTARDRETVCNGSLRVRNRENGELLAELPIDLINTDDSEPL